MNYKKDVSHKGKTYQGDLKFKTITLKSPVQKQCNLWNQSSGGWQLDMHTSQ